MKATSPLTSAPAGERDLSRRAEARKAKARYDRARASEDRIKAALNEAQARAEANRRIADREVGIEPLADDEVDAYNETVDAIKAQKKLDARVEALKMRHLKAVGKLASTALALPSITPEDLPDVKEVPI